MTGMMLFSCLCGVTCFKNIFQHRYTNYSNKILLNSIFIEKSFINKGRKSMFNIVEIYIDDVINGDRIYFNGLRLNHQRCCLNIDVSKESCQLWK